jgi:hypothetical protein
MRLFICAICAICGLSDLRADTPIKDLKVSGTSTIAGGTFSIQTGVIVTAAIGSTITINGALDASAATSFKVGTLTSGTNANIVLDANGTGRLDIRDTITTGTNGDLVLALNGTGKLDLRAAPLKAGTATAGTAPLKFTSGTNLTTPESGTVNYDGSFYYVTSSTPTRQRISTDAAPVAIAASAIDWTLGATFTKTLAANTTFTMSNATDGRTIVVAVTNTASNYTVTWTGVTWSGGTAPVQTIGVKTDVYTFVKVGAVIYGSAVQNF